MRSRYLVPLGDGEAEIVEKRSRFIGRVYLVEDEQRALNILNGLRKHHWDATHNVYAYEIHGGATRFSDDGEPSGTAGRPVLEVFTREGITNYLCVVTRYFGGTLLGAGGLVRAYAASAKAALNAAGIAEMRRCITYTFSVDYALYERVKLDIESAGGVIVSTDYAVDITISVRLQDENASDFEARLIDLSAGKIAPKPNGECYVPVAVEGR